MSDIEKQRLENIKRNQDLLRQLELDSLTSSIGNEARPPPKKQKLVNKKPRIKKEVAPPSRRSRRLAGVQMEDTEEYRKQVEIEEEEKRRRAELEELRRTRLYGDFNLIDLMTDKRLGNLKFEDKVMGNHPVNIKQEESSVTQEYDAQINIKKESDDAIKQEDDEDIDTSSDNKVLEIFRDLGGKFSAGDFYELIRKQVDYNDKVLESKRKEFDNLKLYAKFDPNDIKITHQRITAMNIHPSKDNRVIVAGDKTGDVGIWSVDSTSEDEPTIAILKPHGKSVSKVLTRSSTQIITSAYDGSIRLLDLNKLQSLEALHITDPYQTSAHDLGVSDTNMCVEGDPNILYATTLSGNFYQHDLRTPFKSLDESKFLRLHDKKIGSFAINPNLSYQIATASLDRSMRIWDLRNVSRKNAAWSEFDIKQQSPHLYGTFNSRLSVSCVDWNMDNHLVCNGYDDYINLFDLSSGDNPVTEWSENYQPKPNGEELPENIKSFTKIRHNCQTGRWVSILKSKWQISPKDGVQKFAIANMNRGIDVYDQQGQILAHLSDRDLVGAVPAVVAFHPSENWIVGGSASGKVYLFE